jgi:hypothetical protein
MRHNQLFVTIATLVLLALLVGACRPATISEAAPAVRIPEITIKATEYAFEAPDRLEAGLISISLENAGQEAHEAQFVRLNDGVTLEQFKAALENGVEATLPLITLAGGVTTTPAGQQAQVVLSLTEGRYVLASFVSADDEVPNAAKGMLKAITVVAPSHQMVAPEPRFDVSVGMQDFVFEMPVELKAGPQRWKITNHGQQPHEFSIGKLAPGKTIEDVLAWGETFEGEPPGEEIASISVMAPGQSLWTDFDLAAGDYILICFFPDPASEMPHAMMGMIHSFQVK